MDISLTRRCVTMTEEEACYLSIALYDARQRLVDEIEKIQRMRTINHSVRKSKLILLQDRLQLLIRFHEAHQQAHGILPCNDPDGRRLFTEDGSVSQRKLT